MAMVDELGAAAGSVAGAGVDGVSQKGCFVMWQMVPNKWLIELVVGGHKVVAGSDGNVAWRHTPWLGAHAAKGGVRPLRRALQASSNLCWIWFFFFFLSVLHVLFLMASTLLISGPPLLA